MTIIITYNIHFMKTLIPLYIYCISIVYHHYF